MPAASMAATMNANLDMNTAPRALVRRRAPLKRAPAPRACPKGWFVIPSSRGAPSAPHLQFEVAEPPSDGRIVGPAVRRTRHRTGGHRRAALASTPVGAADAGSIPAPDHRRALDQPGRHVRSGALMVHAWTSSAEVRAKGAML